MTCLFDASKKGKKSSPFSLLSEMKFLHVCVTIKLKTKAGGHTRMAENHIFPFLWMRGEAEEILREEIGKIAECGIKAVCVEARPHDDFCGDGWWHDMDIVIDEAKKRDMKIWILDDKHFPTGYANGLIEKKYPERKKLYINCTTADVFGSSHKLTLNISRMLKPTIGYWEIGKPVNEEERKNNRMLAIAAVRFYEGDVFTEDVIDLTDTFDGTFATFELPEGQWRVYVIYKTRTDGGNESYINMIDKESAHTQIEGVYEAHYAHYADEFGKTIAGFFSDEPQFGNTSEMGFDMNVGRRKMPLPWSDELQEMMEEKYGNAFLSYLPYLFAETKEKQMGVQIRYDYMDMVSKLYQKNFSDMIGAWCAEHGVEYIGHVVEDNGIHSRLGMGAAHYFRAMSGQDMAGIDCIGGQIVYGAPVETRRGMVDADGEFYHYALGKMGASCGHLDPKKKGRTMCELFGAYGWSFGVRDMKYLLDHLLAKGVNYLVPHAFSMADYPDIDCPPHFYARGNNPEFPYFAELMKYGNRMCDLLSGGRHIASVAVLYDGEADWSGEHMPMQKVCRELLGSQIDLDIVSLDMLCDLSAYNGACDGNTLQINGETFGALVIPYVKQISARLADVLTEMDGLPVFFVDAMPDQVIGQGEKEIRLPKSCVQVQLINLCETLKAHGMYEVEAAPAYKNLSVYHYEKDRHIFMLLNESAEQSFSGNVCLPIGEDVVYYDAMKDCYENAEVKPAEHGKGVWVSVDLEPGESCVLMEKKEIVCESAHRSSAEMTEGCDMIDLSEDWMVGKRKAKEDPETMKMDVVKTLTPISDTEPAFAGVIRYEKTFTLDGAEERLPKEAYLKAGHVYEMMKVTVNGQQAGIRLAPPYQLPVGEYLNAGENTLQIEVATTPARDQLNYPQPPFDFSHEAMEPTGMFGEVVLFVKEEK